MNDNEVFDAGSTLTFPCPPLSSRPQYRGIVKVTDVVDGVVTFKQVDDVGEVMDTNFVCSVELFRRNLRSARR